MDLRHPPAEVAVDAELAVRLLESQHPEYLTGPVTYRGEGWDNFTFRVGRECALRVPRREIGVELLLNEQRWLPEVASRLAIAVPVPLAVGVPSKLFPWPWSVVPWIEGTTAEDAPLSESAASLLAEALRSLHRPATPDAPTNPYRGGPLQERADVVEGRLGRLGLHRLWPVWRAALGASPPVERVWLHGDLHPKNVLVRDGELAGLIDWGDMTGGDVATDLACAWTLFDPGARVAFRHAYGPSDADWSRAAGWAVHFGAAMLDSGEPAHAAIGQRIVERLVGDQ